MPTYEYACTECGESLEAVQKFSDNPLTVCPACGGRLRKLFSPVGIVFKGSGFYRTDSRSPASVNGSKNGSSSSDSSESSGSSAASEKPAGSDAKSSGSDSGSSGSAAKSEKKADKGGSGKSSSTGTKVA
ncbi:MAG TPA: FmdB family zinc ribbon protein [Streptosporangiaceae bacterium]|nr:FmdB family zinc ribbon protein [Streptosporangiaceae bacterium]